MLAEWCDACREWHRLGEHSKVRPPRKAVTVGKAVRPRSAGAMRTAPRRPNPTETDGDVLGPWTRWGRMDSIVFLAFLGGLVTGLLLALSLSL